MSLADEWLRVRELSYNGLQDPQTKAAKAFGNAAVKQPREITAITLEAIEDVVLPKCLLQVCFASLSTGSVFKSAPCTVHRSCSIPWNVYHWWLV